MLIVEDRKNLIPFVPKQKNEVQCHNVNSVRLRLYSDSLA